MHSIRKREIQALCADNLDSFFRSLLPENVEQMVRDTLQMPYLANANARVIRESLECEIDGAKERHAWCRHLRILERDTGDNVARYSRAPERCCHCEHFGTKSMITDTDWRALLTAFKRTRCDGCTLRDPREKKP